MVYGIVVIAAVSLLQGFSPMGPVGMFERDKMALTVYGEHSGQFLFEESRSANSVLNSLGFHANFSPFHRLQLGLYAGGVEFDHHGPGNNYQNLFDSRLTWNAGISLRLLSRRFAGNKMQINSNNSAGYFTARNDAGDKRRVMEYHFEVMGSYKIAALANVGAGGEFLVLDGDTEDFPGLGQKANMFGNRHYLRGIINAEFYPPHKNREPGTTYIILGAKVGPEPGFASEWGLEGASLFVGFGVITSLFQER